MILLYHLIGFYLTSNPLEKFDADLQELSHVPKEIDENSIIRIGGIITDIQYRFDKNGNKWALITLDILTSSVQVYVFNDCFNKYNEIIEEDQMCFIIGKSFNDGSTQTLSRMVANKIYQLDNLRKKITKEINILINYSEFNKNILEEINKRWKRSM